MKIVIELSDETYKDIKEENSIYGINNGLSARITGKVVGAIQNGTQADMNGIPLDKIRAEIDRQEKWLLYAGYTVYNVDIALDAIKSVVAESEGKEC